MLATITLCLFPLLFLLKRHDRGGRRLRPYVSFLFRCSPTPNLRRSANRLPSRSAKSGRGEDTIPTNALIVLVEQYTEDLGLFADLSGEGAGVQGVTEFFTGGKPRIARELSKQTWRSHRLRTTLAQEYGHVRLHAPLWEDRRRRASHTGACGKRCCRQTR